MEVVEPVRVERTYVQKLDARPEEVFPLLCPIRELEWVEGWNPLLVVSHSGMAEEDCIFLTGEKEPESFWVITKRDSKNFIMEIIKVTPGMTVAKINISLKADGEHATAAEVTYMYTALSGEGEDFVLGYTESFYEKFMKQWETALNSYLQYLRAKRAKA
ncbi:MAG: hypothetical protein GX433_00490 [Deltaproteobacteria bacterium]|jgi:hypothetical protein|nr:hypothetical protein [Deltaproteobacteria bacterium]